MGELAREINDKFGPKKRKSEEAKKRIGDEIADILFTLACLANSLGIDLEKEFKKMMKKYQKRDNSRYRKKKKF